jgi:hypothetical protein
MANVDEVIENLEAKLARALKSKRRAQRKAGCAIEWLKIIEGDVTRTADGLRKTAGSGLEEVRRIK